MTYICSDIHGFKDLYYDFLDYVHFSDDDKLYIIGDVLDRGSNGIALIHDIMKRKNVILIKGNHEKMNLEVFEELLNSQSKQESEEIIKEELNIMPIGQGQTLYDFAEINKKEQAEIIDYINCLPCYIDITVGSKKYLLVHGGLPDFNDVMDIDFYSEDELLFGPHDYTIEHFEEKSVIIGHTPTRFIQRAEPDKIFIVYKEDGIAIDSINLDCGLGFGGKLGIVCLDTLEELYFS